MTDLLDELRAADPVTAAPAPSQALRRRATRPARRTRGPVFAAAAVLAVGVAVVVAAIGRHGSTDLAARAYAATNPAGHVIHWRVDYRFVVKGHTTAQRDSFDGWSGAGVTHVVFHENGRLIADTRITAGKLREWASTDNLFMTLPAPKAPDGPGAILDSLHDPVASFRAAYRARKLRRLSPSAYQARYQGLVVTYELAQRTGVLRRIVMRVADDPDRSGDETVLAVSDYQRLPLNAKTRAHLALLPHPSAGLSRIDARSRFAVLRRGSPPTGKILADLQGFAKDSARSTQAIHTYPEQARRLTPHSWLLPGRGWICVVSYAGMVQTGGTKHDKQLAAKLGGGFGGGCNTISKVIEHGYGEGGRAGQIVVVPDGVRKVVATLRGKGTKSFAVRDNHVVLPSFGYGFVLVR